MDEQSQDSLDKPKGSMTHIVAWVLLALALAGLFCWRVATTDPRWRARQTPAADVQNQ